MRQLSAYQVSQIGSPLLLYCHAAIRPSVFEAISAPAQRRSLHPQAAEALAANLLSRFIIPNRQRERADVLSLGAEWRFERFLRQIEVESGVDVRF
jgi:hypothetical protein